MPAYCTAFGLRRGYLVYAQGNEEPRGYSINAAAAEIVAHRLDVSSESAELLAQIAALAEAISGPAEPAGVGGALR